jgi:hypothetical protein
MAKDATAGLPASDVSEDVYAALLTTLSASARGRAFLAEFARRNRAAETDMLLAAMARLEAMVAAQNPPAAEAPLTISGIPDVTWEVDVSLPAAPREAAAAVPTAAESPPPETAPAAPAPPPRGVCEEPTPPRVASAEAAPPRDPLRQLMGLSENERLALFS